MTIRDKISELGEGYPINIGFNNGWIFAGNIFNGICDLLGYLYDKELVSYERNLKEYIGHLNHFDEYWQEEYQSEREALEKDLDIKGKLQEYEENLQKCEDKILKCGELIEKFEKQRIEAISKGKGAEARKLYGNMNYNKVQLNEARGRKAYLVKTIREYSTMNAIPEDIKEKRRQDLINDIEYRKQIDFERTVNAIDMLKEELERPTFADREITEFYRIKTPWDDPKRMAIKADGIAHGKYWGEFEQVKDRHMLKLIERFTIKEVQDG